MRETNNCNITEFYEDLKHKQNTGAWSGVRDGTQK